MTKIILKEWKPCSKQVSKENGDCTNCKYSLVPEFDDPCESCIFDGNLFTLWEPQE